MLLEADWILPVSGPPLAGAGIAIADGKIAEIGPAERLRSRWGGDGHRSFPGCALIPGLINAHSHLEYSAFRGFSGSCGFGEWMLRLLLARRKLEPHDYAVSARWGARECLRAGMTFLADASFEGWTSARAAGEAGLRARVYLEVLGLEEGDLPQIVERLEERLGVLRDACGPLVEPGLSPHAPYTVSPRLYRELARYGSRHGLRLATHVAESKAEVELLTRGTGPIARAYKAARLWKGERWSPPGISPVAFLKQSGALSPDTLAVHCVEIDDDDIVALADSRAAVAHCPRSNARLQCGLAPVVKLRRAGVLTGLGTDSLASNESLDLFCEMRAAMEISRTRSLAEAGDWDVTAAREVGAGHSGDARGLVASVSGGADGSSGISARRSKNIDRPATFAGPPLLDEEAVLRMATLEGAAALGLDDRLGSLDVGKEADIVVVHLPRQVQTGADVTHMLVSRATAMDVHMSMIAGAVVFERLERPMRPDVLDLSFAAVQRKLGISPQYGE